jgi:hypothetical protein
MMPRFSSRSWLAVTSLILPLLFGVLAAAAAEPTFHHGDWPFNSPTRPTPPNIANQNWATNPIDQFVAARLEAAGLQPNPAADKATLLRRVTYDLTGLPPTTAELDTFLADKSDGAYTRVVDRLLASPRFGERWAQHWLDLVRYAETDGFKADQLRPNAYRYRDYVIDSFNRDRPFDEFIRQQIAGDELEPNNADALIATGFLRLYADEDNAANLFQRRQEILDDITDTTGLVFLGLTMGCAQCHDHKFDEIPQTDYFRLQAFFASLSEHDDCNIASPAEVANYEADMARWQDATATIRADIDNLTKRAYANLVEYALEKYEPSISSCYRKPPSERTPLEEQIARMVQWRNDRQLVEKPITEKLSRQDKEKYAALTKQLAEFDSLKPKPLPHAMAVCDVGGQAPPTHLLEGGSWKRPAAEISPGFPQFLGDTALPATKVAHLKANQPTTGRRTQLAEWLTRPDHPLTSRIIVNRLWQQHFGRGIVATTNDFGMQGERPTHPELLDWLAVELVENGWSLKHIHRLMVMSATYRQASIIDGNAPNATHATKVDPENKLLWHANRRRLEGEQIRDAMLQIASQLNLSMHGPSARPKLPAGVSERYAWKSDKDAAQRNRRSVYILAKRNMRFPLFEAFDQPDLHQSCPRRAVTITAPQSLAMLNSELTLELANDWAERLVAGHADSERDLIEAAIQSAFCRVATEKETELASKFLADETRLATKREGHKDDPRTEAVAAFCHALFNTNEFISID